MSVELSKAQKEAVRYISSPTLITAGAGSGKTRTLTSKIAYLISELGYNPGNILAITFTNKAAEEMKSRLQAVTGRSIAEFPWVRTFHSACFQILKEHCDRLGYRKPLLIHSDYQQRSNLKRALALVNLDKTYLNPAAAMISMAKNSGNPYTYLGFGGKVPRRREVYDIYNELLMQQNAVDFDDILLLVRDLLRSEPDVLEKYRSMFEYILIDEFQDSNAIQNQIVDMLLRNGNLTVVGDDYQSIYKFRGADPLHFINFPEKYENARIYRLEENYRSTTQIVEASDALIAHNVSRIEKSCFSRREGTPIRLRAFADEEEEASWVADKCREYAMYEKIPYSRMAVLYRTKFCSLAFERAMRFAGIPYKMMGGKGFFERREVQDINGYLICALNPKDDVSFERIINVPRRGIGPGALKKIEAYRGGGISMQEACRVAIDKGLLPKKTCTELESLLIFLKELRNENPGNAIKRVINETDYFRYMEGYSENTSDLDARRENIEQMIYTASKKESIEEYLEDSALIREDQDDSDGDNGQGVRLSTFHAAKGLEYDVVFVVALEEGLIPHWRSIELVPGEDGNRVESKDGIEEERRLMYVAMTRAAHHLLLSWSKFRRGEFTKRSRYLAEIPKRCMSESS